MASSPQKKSGPPRPVRDRRVGGEILRRTILFKGLSSEPLFRLESSSTETFASPGETIIREGDPSDRIWVVVEGEVEVVKGQSAAGGSYRITTLGETETVGELGLVDDSGASASVRTLAPSRFLVIPIQAISALMREKAPCDIIYENLSEQLNQRLRYTNEVTVRALANELEQTRARVGLAVTLVTLVILVTFYTYCLGILSAVAREWGTTTVVTVPASLLVFAVVCYKIRNSGFPLSFFGLTIANWKRAVVEAIAYSTPILALALVSKWVFIRYVAADTEIDLIDLQSILATGDYTSLRDNLFDTLVYVGLVVPIQEFVARGAMQSLLQRFLTGPRHVFWAVVSSNLMFSVAHLFVSPQFAFISFLVGLFWGWLYARHGTLIAPVTSHALIGVWGLSIVGVKGFLL